MKKRRNVLIISICSVVAAAIFAAFMFLSRFGGTPEEIRLPEPSASSGNSSPEPSSEIQKGTSAEVNPKNVLQVLKLMDRADNYYQSYTVTFSGGSPVSVSVWRKGDVIKISSDRGTLRKNTLVNADTVYFWYEGDSVYYTSPLGSDFSADDELMIPSYEELLKGPDPEDAYFTYSEHLGENVLYLRTTNSGGLTAEYWISSSTGLLVRYESSDLVGSVYSMEQTSVTCPLTSDEVFTAAFTLPDGTVKGSLQQ